LCHKRFDGGETPLLNRAVFVSGDAATVLPYDLVRDRVMLIEQFRPGPLARGDTQPWLLEPIAGRIDAGETPAEAVRREAEEEAGLHLGALHSCGNYYPSPGAKTEYLYSFIGIADLPDEAAGLGGLPGEGEDIRSHVISFDALMALVGSGEAATGPLLISAWWLAANRDRLRRANVA
jgi:nudix-type nucleoside diphosphatase (YffH/AdpP family)